MSEPTPEEYTRAFYDRLSHAYDLIADASERTSRMRGLELLAVREGESVLELGYGTGTALVELARSVGPAGRVCGIDLSPGMHDVALRRVTASGLGDRTTLELGNARALPWEPNAFDAAFVSFTLEILPADGIAEALAELRRVLRPEGRLGVVALAESEHPGPVTELYKWLHRHFPHFIDCEPIRAAELLEQSGFRIEAREDTSIWGLEVVILRATCG